MKYRYRCVSILFRLIAIYLSNNRFVCTKWNIKGGKAYRLTKNALKQFLLFGTQLFILRLMLLFYLVVK